MISAQFLCEVVGYALQIAKRQRNEDHLQSVEILENKFQAELAELEDAEGIWDEMPDLCYYAICLAAQGQSARLWQLEYEICEHFEISAVEIEAATRAKYSRRASGLPKDFDAERKAIQDALKSL